MNAVEKLQAAIDKLEAERDAAAQGEWVQAHPNGVAAPSYEPIEDGASPSDARLIVTLHRTIDAQLAILRAAWSTHDDFEFMRGDYTGRGPLKVTPLGIAAVALADAILGEGQG